MTGPRVFVCYREEVQSDCLFAQQLIDDLRNAGNEIATLESIDTAIDDEQFTPALQQTLTTCDWVILTLTPEALQSPKIAMVVNVALTFVMQKKLQNLFAMIATPIEQQDMPPTWTTIRKFDATQDYPRALARLLLTLQPTYATLAPPPTPLPPVAATVTTLESPALEKRPTRPLPPTDGKPIALLQKPTFLRRFQRLFVPLTIFLVLILVTGFLIAAVYGFSAQPTSTHPLSTPKVTHKLSITLTPNIAATTTALFANPQLLYEQLIKSRPLLSDPLKNATRNNWTVGATPNGGCAFLQGLYDVTALQFSYRQPCFIQNVTFRNIALQAQMSFVADGNNLSPCGLIVRMQNQVMASFRFNLYANGHYELIGADHGDGKIPSLGSGSLTTFTPHQPITLTVITKSSRFYVYANGKFITSATDPTYSTGKIGFVCRDKGAPVEAVFSKAKVWNI